MIIRLSVPSKTFLVGEYAVLRGGPALVLSTAPRFEWIARRLPSGERASESPVEGIAAESPAGKWLDQRSPLLREWSLEFRDPHSGRGGLGASSAQFVLAHAFTTFLQSSVSRAVAGYDLKALWNDFRVLSGGQASGADVLAQTVGQVAQLHMATCESVAQRWPFAELAWAVVRTQRKVPTHEHLRELSTESVEPLVPLSFACVEAFHGGDSAVFVNRVGEYAEALAKHGFVIPETEALLKTLRAHSWCRVAKGCGALGADTILVMFAASVREVALQGIQTLGLELVATDTELTEGLEMNWSWNEG